MPKPSKGAEFVGFRSKMKTARKNKRARVAEAIKAAEAFAAMVAKGLQLAQDAASAMGETFDRVLGYVNGMPLFVVNGSHLHEGVKPIVDSVIRRLMVAPDAKAPVIVQTVDMGKPVGKTHLVKVKGDEKFFETKRGQRPYKSRFVEGRESEDTSKVTMVFAKQPNGSFLLYTAYVGDQAPKELAQLEYLLTNGKPEDKEAILKEIEEVKAFWAEHAFTRSALND